MPNRTAGYTVGTLDVSTWDAFAELVERNGGIFGGCWCMSAHRLEGVVDRHAAEAGSRQSHR